MIAWLQGKNITVEGHGAEKVLTSGYLEDNVPSAHRGMLCITSKARDICPGDYHGAKRWSVRKAEKKGQERKTGKQPERERAW